MTVLIPVMLGRIQEGREMLPLVETKWLVNGVTKSGRASHLNTDNPVKSGAPGTYLDALKL